MDLKDTRPLGFGKKVAPGKARFTPLSDEAVASWNSDIHRAYVTELLKREELEHVEGNVADD